MNESVASTGLAKSADTAFAGAFAPRARSPLYVRRSAPSGVMNLEIDRLSALMERYAMGEDDVFAQIYESMAPRLYRFCLRLTARIPEADDCFQETFLKLHRSRATYMAGANALHWVYAIARSVYLTRLRYWRRRPEDLGSVNDVAERDELLPEECASPEAETLAEHMLDTVAFELSRMSEKNRTAYVLVKEEGLSIKEAATVLGTTAGAVKQRAHRACEHLRAALDAGGWKVNGIDTI
jgi:RNA polymerase sigma-70 factor (ECF subfamily)